MDPSAPNVITQVEPYIGDGTVVRAPSAGQTVRVQPVWQNGLRGFVRIPMS